MVCHKGAKQFRPWFGPGPGDKNLVGRCLDADTDATDIFEVLPGIRRDTGSPIKIGTAPDAPRPVGFKSATPLLENPSRWRGLDGIPVKVSAQVVVFDSFRASPEGIS